MSLPLSRNRTYSGASQIASVDLNDLQDQIIALSAAIAALSAPAATTLQIPPTAFKPYSSAYAYSANAAALEINGAGIASYFCPLILPTDSEITSATLYLKTGADADTRSFSLRSGVATTHTTAEIIDATVSSTLVSTELALALPSVPIALDATKSYSLVVFANDTDQISGVTLTYERVP